MTAVPSAPHTTTLSATLHAYGRIPWVGLAAVLDEATTAWADYHGFHIGHAPTEAPPYSHVWAWTGNWLLRARIDGSHAIVAVLCMAGPPPAGLPTSVPERVHVTQRRSNTWPSETRRVGPLADTVGGRSVLLHQIDGERPVTFVELR